MIIQRKYTKSRAKGLRLQIEQVRIAAKPFPAAPEFGYLRPKTFPVKKLLLTLPLIALLAGACRKDGGPSWDTGLVLPLAHASMSLDHLVTDSLLSTNADGTMKFVYTTTFSDLSTDTLFDIPDTTISNLYAMPFQNFPLNGGDAFPIPPSTPVTFNVNTVQLVNGVLSAGYLNVVLRNDIRRKIVVRYQIPCASKNNVTFDTSFVVPAAPDSLNHTFMNVSINLSGYSIDFTGPNNNQVNTMTTQISASIAIGELPTTVYQNETVGAITTFTGIRPFYIRGYFGNQTVQVGPEESGLDFFNRIVSGTLGLDSLTMTLHIDNYVGMDSRLTVNSIWSRNSRTNNTVYLNHSVIGTPINVNRGQYSNNWPPVIPSSYNYVFNNGNSNAKALAENLPDKLGYDLTLVTNPLGNVSGNNDFFYSGFGINAQLSLELPVSFYADRLTLQDTVETNFTSVKNKEDILQGTLTLYAQNSFPFSATVQIYLLDGNNQITDSIVAQPNVISAGIFAPASGNYLFTNGFNSSEIQIPLSPAQTQSLLHSSNVVFKTVFDTNSAPSYVKVYSTNRLDLQLTADFDYHFGN